MSDSPVKAYLSGRGLEECNTEFLAYLANLEVVSKVSPEIASSIVQELLDQRSHIKLIASENYCSLATQLSMGNLLTDKYAEGYPFHRFYAGCDNIDIIEAHACELACKVFGCEHAYVQAHSGADANLIAFWAILTAKVQAPRLEEMGVKSPVDLSREDWNKIRAELGNQRMLGLDFSCGGHLTHGYRFNVSAQMFDVHSYGVSKETGLIDYDEVAQLAREVKPLILLAGYSAYPRAINFAKMREIADEVGATFMVDMAHFAGLVAGGVFEGDFNPTLSAHVVTTTTHKSIRGPRGGLVLCTEEFADYVDKGCPMVIGGPLGQMMAAKAVALTEAATPEFKAYAKRIVDNAKHLAQGCIDNGMTVPTGGTDNHLVLIDVRPFGLTGRQAESAIRESGITLNRNAIPYDPNGAWFTSGLRLGTPAMTTLGMGEAEMKEIASILAQILSNTSPADITAKDGTKRKSRQKFQLAEDIKTEARQRAQALLERYPVYPELDAQFLKQHFIDNN